MEKRYGLDKATARPCWLVVGAGISLAPPANVPLWRTIRDATLDEILDTLMAADARLWNNRTPRYAFQKLKEILRRNRLPEVTLECLSHAFGRVPIQQALAKVIQGPGAMPRPNLCHQAIAEMCRRDMVEGIICLNFDSLLETAMKNVDVGFEVCIQNPPKESALTPIFKVHGSVDSPETLSFVRRDYNAGLPQKIIDFLKEHIRQTRLLICGYSGYDGDVYPLLKSILLDPQARVEGVVVDPKPLRDNPNFLALGSYIQYFEQSAGSYLASLANIAGKSERDGEPRQECSLAPERNLFSFVVFAADSLLAMQIGPEHALRLFFLAQDIAEDEGDYAKLIVAHAGKSICLFRMQENVLAEGDYSIARTLLASLLSSNPGLLETPVVKQFGYSFDQLKGRGGSPWFRTPASSSPWPTDPPKATDQELSAVHHVMLWEFRARFEAALSALNLSRLTDSQESRQELANISQELFAEMENWPSVGWTLPEKEELTTAPRIFAHFINAYRKVVLGSGEATRELRKCLARCQESGYFREALYCLFLLERVCHQASAEDEELYETIKSYSGVEEREVRLALAHSGEPFELTMSDYQPLSPRPKSSYLVGCIRRKGGHKETQVLKTIEADSAKAALFAVAPTESLSRWDLEDLEDTGQAFLMRPIEEPLTASDGVDCWYADSVET